MTRLSALIIEDDPKLNFILETALQQAGFITNIDSRGDQYQTHLAQSIPDLIILDLHLPFSSGRDILKVLKADANLKNTMIVVTTADVYLARKLEMESEHILVKPVSIAHLRKIIEDKWPEEFRSDKI